MSDQTDKTWTHWSILIALKLGQLDIIYLLMWCKRKYTITLMKIPCKIFWNKKFNLNIIMPQDLITSLQELWREEYIKWHYKDEISQIRENA